jgi:hypothetical protein
LSIPISLAGKNELNLKTNDMTKNIFDKAVTDEIIERIQKLQPTSKPEWGKMSADQMLAHCNVTYEYIYEPGKHKKPGALFKFMMKLFVKNAIVNEKPYKKNGPTGPDFKVTATKNFEEEKSRLIDYILQTQALGAEHFDGKESHGFGALNKKEWNNMFYKHLDHHLRQFGV